MKLIEHKIYVGKIKLIIFERYVGSQIAGP